MQSKLSRLQKTILLILSSYQKRPHELNRRMLSQKIATALNKNASSNSFQVSLCNAIKSLEKRGLIESVSWGKYRTYLELTLEGTSTAIELGRKQKKILLVDIDSTIPNLALMKLSAFYKQSGDKVSLLKHPCKSGQERINHRFDKVFISSLYEENKGKTLEFAKQFHDVEIGGFFIDPLKVLPYEVEHIMPDYALYKCNYSLGYTTRGCINDCPWCIVPEKEGKITANCDIYEFWAPEHKHIELLDNNPMALPNHFKKIADQIQKENLSVSFHGLDAHLLNDENTEILSQLRIKPEPRFAFDRGEDEPWVRRGIKLLQKYGIKRALWYVLVGFNTTWEQDMYRITLLKKLGQRPYVMRYGIAKDDPQYTLLSSWVNQYEFFHTMSFERFVECSKDRSKLSRANHLSW